jgi:hypothetical protein
VGLTRTPGFHIQSSSSGLGGKTIRDSPTLTMLLQSCFGILHLAIDLHCSMPRCRFGPKRGGAGAGRSLSISLPHPLHTVTHTTSLLSPRPCPCRKASSYLTPLRYYLATPSSHLWKSTTPTCCFCGSCTACRRLSQKTKLCPISKFP